MDSVARISVLSLASISSPTPIIHATITKGFIAAGLMNLSVLLFSKFFTNPVIPATDPNVASNFGLLMIVLWGLAYIAVAHKYFEVKWLVRVFALEKLAYGVVWSHWILNNDVSKVFEQDLLAGIFFSVYGINDWIFFLFFTYVFIKLWRSESELPSQVNL